MKTFSLLILFFTFVLIPNASAQIMIEEGKVTLSSHPGETINNAITIHNTSDQSINIRAYWGDFVYISPFDGKKSFLPAGSTPNSISKFAVFSPQDFPLGPFAQKKINYSIKVPQSASGGYYGVIFLEKIDEGLKDRTGIKVVSRVGCLFFLEMDDRKKSAEIKELNATEVKLEGDFLNTGNVILIPQGIYYVLDKSGLVTDRGEIPKFYLPPNERAKFDVNLSPALKVGKFTLVITFDLGEGDTLVKEIDFTKDTDSSLKIIQVRD